MHKLPILITVAAAAALASCTEDPGPSMGMQADARLQQMLAGKTAGPAMSCIPRQQAQNARPLVTPGAVAFVATPGLIYVSNVETTGCADAANPNYSVVTVSHGSDLCSGDRVELQDLQTRGFHGACTLSSFVPYRSQ